MLIYLIPIVVNAVGLKTMSPDPRKTNGDIHARLPRSTQQSGIVILTMFPDAVAGPLIAASMRDTGKRYYTITDPELIVLFITWVIVLGVGYY